MQRLILLLMTHLALIASATMAPSQEYGEVRTYGGEGLLYSKLAGEPITRESYLVSQRAYGTEDSFGFEGTIRYVFKYTDGTSNSQQLNFQARCGGPGGWDPFVDIWTDDRDRDIAETITITNPDQTPAGVEKDAYDLFRAVCHPQRFKSPTVGAQASSSAEEFIRYQNRDSEGSLLRTMQSVDLQSCASACGNETQCQAYVYDNWNRWCSLKYTVRELLLSPKAITGVRAGVAQPRQSTLAIEMRRYRGKAFPAGGTVARARSFEACEQRCRVGKSCVAFTYVKTSKQCRLMESAGEYVGNKAADSGAKFQTGR